MIEKQLKMENIKQEVDISERVKQDMIAVKPETVKVENLRVDARHIIDDMPSPSASPPPPTASPVVAAESPGGSPEENAPVMLTTMQPVPLNIMDLPKNYMSNSYIEDDRQEFIYQVDGKNVEIVRQDDLPPGTVSVVVQQPGGLLPAYQTPGTTVLVLSELVEDVGNVR